MRFTGILVGGILAFLATGCGHNYEQGRGLDATEVSSIRKGQTTKQEIGSMFGTPYSTTIDSSGNVILQYMHMQMNTKVKGATYIPIIGGLVGGAKSETTTQSLLVTVKDNIVVNYTYSESGSKTDSSILGGTTTTN